MVLISIAFATSYFAKPHEPNVEIVSYIQELPDPKKDYPKDSGLAERISRSYGLALVLVISEYTQRNAMALDSIRGWARQQFQKDAGFLHNMQFEPMATRHVSIIESVCYNLLAAPSYALQEAALNFVRDQIAAFHTTNAYLRFRSDYFDSFGLDKESALLLARYQSDKARLAVDVLLSSAFWLAVFIIGAILALRAKPGVRSTRAQRVLAYFWVIMAVYYLCSAWSQNQVVLLISAWVCGWIGFYIRRPLAISLGDDKGLSFKLLTPSRSLVALAYWITFSLIAIQVMTWIKSGTLISPDPITLLISSFSGNFLYDPISAKKTISQVVGIIWIVVSLWVFREITVGLPSAEVEQELASLKEVSP